MFFSIVFLRESRSLEPMSGATALDIGGGEGELEAAVRSIISRNDSPPSLEPNSLLSPSSLSSDPDSGAYLTKASSNYNVNRTLANLMSKVADSNGGGGDGVPSLPFDDMAVNSPLPMDIDEERISRKRGTEVTGEEVRSKVLAVDPSQSKKNVSETCSGISAPT